MNSVIENLQLTLPISESPFYVLMETSGSNETHDEEKLNDLIEELMTNGFVQDGTVAADLTQIKVSVLRGTVKSLKSKLQTLTNSCLFLYKENIVHMLPALLCHFSYEIAAEINALISLVPKYINILFKNVTSNGWQGCLCSVTVKALDCRIIVSKFELQLCYYIHFQTNILGKMGKLWTPLSSQLWVKQ